jgi:hypothetical protein
LSVIAVCAAAETLMKSRMMTMEKVRMGFMNAIEAGSTAGNKAPDHFR